MKEHQYTYYEFNLDDITKEFIKNSKDTLKSFYHEYQVINFLSMQRTFYHFLTAVRAVKGLRFVLFEDGTTSLAFNDRQIPGTRKRRFQEAEDLGSLLQLSGLN